MPTMTAQQAPNARERILDKLAERAYRPTELFQQLHEISESVLKDALAALIDARLIELSPDRHIKLRQHQVGPVRAAR